MQSCGICNDAILLVCSKQERFQTAIVRRVGRSLYFRSSPHSRMLPMMRQATFPSHAP